MAIRVAALNPAQYLCKADRDYEKFLHKIVTSTGPGAKGQPTPGKQNDLQAFDRV